jgi:uncharacterized damage-inducible protein DinB
MTDYQYLFRYHFDTTARLLEGAASLSEADRHTRPDYSLRSIHDLFVHLLGTSRGWRIGMESGSQPASLDADQYQRLSVVREGLEQERSAWAALLEALSDSQIAEGVELTSTSGAVFPVVRWRVLQHLILHGMQHHAEIAQMLTNLGQSPGDLDVIFYR